MRRPLRQSGFTLLELLAVVVVLGVIFGIAVPAFQLFIANQKVRNASFDLFSSLNMARSEATKRGSDVTVIATNPANWAAGWKIITGTPGTPGVDLAVRDPLDGDVNVAEAANIGAITYKSTGRLSPGASPTFTFKSTMFTSATPRCLNVDLSGKAISGC